MDQPPSTEKTGPQKGDVIEGKLEIEGIIAEGRTSTVVSAIDRGNNDRKVAVKIARGSDLESVERFKRAARGMARLTSPYTVKVLGLGTTQDGAPCMTMEYLEGRTLAQKVMQSGPLPIEEACHWMLQVCDAVADAHAQKLLHRDLDVENLFLAMPPIGSGGAPSVRVLDFGLAPVWRLGKGDGRLRPGDVPGTSFAMAPELARGSDIDERVDIWGIGACFFRLLTNKHPYNARNLAELCTRILAERPPDVAKVRADVTPALAAVVKKCLEREPNDRFRTVRDVMRAIQATADEAPYTPQVPTERATLEQLRAIDDQRMTPMVFRASPDLEGERITMPGSIGSDESDSDDAATAFYTKEELARQVGSSPFARGQIGAATPQAMRAAPEFEAIANRLEPPPKKNSAPPPKMLPPKAPLSKRNVDVLAEDAPSTQPLGRLSPFAELPKAPPSQSSPPSDDHSIKPVLIGTGPIAPPLPKPTPERMSAQTAPPPPLPNTAPPPRLPTTAPPAALPATPALAPLPKPSPAMMAAETMQGPAPQSPAFSQGASAEPPLDPSPALMGDETITRMDMPAPLPVFQASPRVLEIPPLTPSTGAPAMPMPMPTPMPTPQPSAPYLPSGMPPAAFQTGPQIAPSAAVPIARPAKGGTSKLLVIALIFALGIVASIGIGLYVARLTTPTPTAAPPPKPSAEAIAAPPSAAPVATTDPVPTSAPSAAPAELEIVAAEPSTPERSPARAPAPVHRRQRRPAPQPATAPSTASTAAKGGSVYDPSSYDP